MDLPLCRICLDVSQMVGEVPLLWRYPRQWMVLVRFKAINGAGIACPIIKLKYGEC